MARTINHLAGIVVGLFGLAGIAATGGTSSSVVALLGGGAFLLALFRYEPTDDEPDATERSPDTGVCAACGKLVATGEARCDDCSVVGHWRK